MRTPRLLLAAAVALLSVLPLNTGHPVLTSFQPPKGAYVKASKSSSSSASVAKSANANEQAVNVNTATGQYSQSASSSASNSLAKSAESNSESYEAYTPGYVCGCGLLARNSGESDFDYYVRIFQVDISNVESVNAFYAKVFKQYKGECNADYIKRVTFIFTKVYPKLDCRFNQAYIKFLQKYYLISYARLDGESDEAWFTRVLTRSSESETDYLVKVAILRKYITFVNWSRVQIDAKSKTGFILISSKETSSSSARSLDETTETTKVVLTEEEVKKTYAKIETEDITTYYKRIVTKITTTESTEEYVKTLSLVRKCYPSLSLWYDVRYLDLVKNYYSSLYARLIDETDEKYFLRIVQRESYETEEQTAERIAVIRTIFPNLILWSDSKYYGTITKKFYLTYYKKSSSENKITYYKRIVAKNSDESDSTYYKRLDCLKRTFPTLDLWYSKEYLDITRQYYIAKYTKVSSETEESLFKRILVKEVEESEEQRIQRVSTILECFPTLSLWSDEKYYDLTKSLYLTIYKKSSSEDEDTYFKRITQRLTKESDEIFIKRVTLIKNTYSTLDLWYNPKYLSITKQYYISKYTRTTSETEESFYKRVLVIEPGESRDLWAQRMEVIHQVNPNWPVWYDTKYVEQTKAFYQVIYKKSTSEDEFTYYKRIIAKTGLESDVTYVNRIYFIKTILNDLDLWYSDQYLDITRSYYIARYTKTSSETEESFYKRVVTKESGETGEQWARRVEVIHKCNPNWPLWYDTKYLALTKNVYQIFYKKSTSEDEKTYYKRITSKVSTESEIAYTNRMTCLKQSFPSLGLWYSTQYLDVTRSYYIARFTKISSETEESCYKRVIAKEAEETPEQWAQRICVIQSLFPSYALWSDLKYYDLVKDFYLTIYKKSTSEDQITYFKRITVRINQEPDAAYKARMTVIEKTFSSLSLWSSVDCLSILKPYYLLKYTKLSGESDEAYFTRLVARESCDISDDVYVRRLYLVQLLTTSSALWYDAKFYDKFTKTFYGIYYKKLDSESCDGWLTRAITLLPGETDEYAIKRIALIKKSSGSCGCWTLDTLSKVQASKVFSAEYITKIRSSFFAISYQKSSSSSSSSTKSATAEANENVVVVKRGGCL